MNERVPVTSNILNPLQPMAARVNTQASFSTQKTILYIETLFIRDIRDTITKPRHDYLKREYARWDFLLLLFLH
jgi:hypothetical protein